MNNSIKITIHDPNDFKHAHIRSQAEELLNQIDSLGDHIVNLQVQARELYTKIQELKK